MTHSRIPKIFHPNPNINIIFENNQNVKYDNSSLYQNILEYANLPTAILGFRFTDLGNG